MPPPHASTRPALALPSVAPLQTLKAQPTRVGCLPSYGAQTLFQSSDCFANHASYHPDPATGIDPERIQFPCVCLWFGTSLPGPAETSLHGPDTVRAAYHGMIECTRIRFVGRCGRHIFRSVKHAERPHACCRYDVLHTISYTADVQIVLVSSLCVSSCLADMSRPLRLGVGHMVLLDLSCKAALDLCNG